MVAGQFSDLAADASGAGEADAPDAAVGDKRLGHRSGVFRRRRNDIADPGRETGLVQYIGEKRPADKGACSLGFITTVLPAANGAAIDLIPRIRGAFRGANDATMPAVSPSRTFA